MMPISRQNSSLMDVIGITRDNNNGNTNNMMGIQRSDSPFQRTDSPFQQQQQSMQQQQQPLQQSMQPHLQRTTSIFNDTLTPTASNVSQAPPQQQPTLPNIMPPPGMMNLYISQWKYIDHQGDQQGPFATDMMSQWYHSNYFQPTLQITLANPSLPNGIDPLQLSNGRFITLNDLVMSVGNAIDPFATYDSMINGIIRQSMPPQQIPPVTVVPQPPVPIPIAEPVTVEEGPPPVNINLEKDVTDTGDYTFQEVLDLPLDSEGRYYHQVTVPVPMQRKLIKKIDKDTVIDTSLNNDPRFNNIWTIKEIAVSDHSQDVIPTAEVETIVKKMETLTTEDTPVVNNRSNETVVPEPEPVKEDVITSVPVPVKEEEEEEEEAEGKIKEEQVTSVEPTEEEKRRLKAELMARQLIEEEEKEAAKSAKKQSKNKKKSKQAKQSKSKKSASATTVVSESVETPVVGGDDTSQSVKGEGDEKGEEPVVKTKLAPWANKSSKSKNKGIPLTSFFELQKNEEMKQQKLEAEKQLEAQRLSEQILNEEKEKLKNKSMLNWANSNNPPSTEIVDIKAQLMKDQEQKKRAKKEAQRQNQSKLLLNDVPNDPSFIEEQQRIWEQLQKTTKGQQQKKSNTVDLMKQSTSSMATTATNPWTRVATTTASSSGSSNNTKSVKKSGSNILKPNTIPPLKKPNKQIGSSTSIPGFKPKFVSSIGTVLPATMSTRTATPMYPGNSSISKRQDFLKWCKSQLRLNPGIAPNSVLEVLLSLPSGNESNEIIADTIYSNSSVMDGRRFAVEFNKKRIECERQVTDPLSWSEALALPEGNDDDWEFQVVSKKKKGKKF